MGVKQDGSLWIGLSCVNLRTAAGFGEADHNSSDSVLRGGKSVALLSGLFLRKRDSGPWNKKCCNTVPQAVKITSHKYSFTKKKSMRM